MWSAVDFSDQRKLAAAFVANQLQPTSVSKAAPQRAWITPKALCKAPLLCHLVFGAQEPLAVEESITPDGEMFFGTWEMHPIGMRHKSAGVAVCAEQVRNGVKKSKGCRWSFSQIYRRVGVVFRAGQNPAPTLCFACFFFFADASIWASIKIMRAKVVETHVKPFFSLDQVSLTCFCTRAAHRSESLTSKSYARSEDSLDVRTGLTPRLEMSGLSLARHAWQAHVVAADSVLWAAQTTLANEHTQPHSHLPATDCKDERWNCSLEACFVAFV